MKKTAVLAIAFWITTAGASERPRVDADIKAYDDHVAQLTREFEKVPSAPGDKTWVKAKLQHMVDVDQYMRGLTNLPAGRSYSEVDEKNTTDLKGLLKIYPWFTISEFGAVSDHNAWLLVQHADHDPAFQREVLAILEPLMARGETSHKNFAYLFDRVATNYHNPAERRPQRYGTQGQCTGPGKWEPFPVEAPEKLDARRAQAGLPPVAEYQKGFADICLESTEETIRKLIEAAKKQHESAAAWPSATRTGNSA